MAETRSNSLTTGLFVGCVPLVLLAVAALFLVPVTECPACIGWRRGELSTRSPEQMSRDCRYCQESGKVTLVKDWLMKRKQGRPCYYMTHDE